MKPKSRCPWVNEDNPLYVKYHDEEWGVPVRKDQDLFELLILEGAQAGLSWEIILKKRENYRQLFANFEPEKVARFSEARIQKLMKEPGIVRNELKIRSTILNARNFLTVQKEFGSFSKYIWAFVENQPIQNNWRTSKDYPARTSLSDQISKDLKKRGFKFIGTTICYAFMQATGIVNDHSVSCFKHKRK